MRARMQPRGVQELLLQDMSPGKHQEKGKLRTKVQLGHSALQGSPPPLQGEQGSVG